MASRAAVCKETSPQEGSNPTCKLLLNILALHLQISILSLRLQEGSNPTSKLLAFFMFANKYLVDVQGNKPAASKSCTFDFYQ